MAAIKAGAAKAPRGRRGHDSTVPRRIKLLRFLGNPLSSSSDTGEGPAFSLTGDFEISTLAYSDAGGMSGS
jgi:hypothetical protein